MDKTETAPAITRGEFLKIIGSAGLALALSQLSWGFRSESFRKMIGSGTPNNYGSSPYGGSTPKK